MPIERDQLKTLAIIGVLFVLFAAAIWLPGHFTRQSLERRIDAARHALGVMPDQGAGLSEWYAQVIDLREQVRGAQRYVPEKDELAQVLRGLTAAMQQHQVTHPELTTRDVQHFANYSLIPANVQFSAPFPQVFGVLDEIEAMPRLIRIDRLDIESNPQRSDMPLAVTMELSTFFSKSQAPKELR